MIKEDFEGFLDVGDKILIELIDANEPTVGTLLKISESALFVRRLDNGKKVMLEISQIKRINEYDEDALEHVSDTAKASVTNAVKTNVATLGAQTNSQIETQTPAFVSIYLPNLPEGVQNEAFDMKASLKGYKQAQSAWNRAESIWRNAKRNHCLQEKKGVLTVACRDILKEFREISVLCAWCGEVFASLEMWQDAFQAFMQANSYSNAFLCAYKVGDRELLLKVSSRWARSKSKDRKEGLRAFFYYASEIAEPRMALELLQELETVAGEELKIVCEGTSKILYKAGKENNLSGIGKESSVHLLAQLQDQLKELLPAEKCGLSLKDIDKQEEPQRQRSRIINYKNKTTQDGKGDFGFLKGNHHNIYFRIEQVEDEALRSRLFRVGDYWNIGEVSYLLGKGVEGIAADHIIPLESVEEFPAITDEYEEGQLYDYNILKDIGQVCSFFGGNQIYNFRMEAVDDQVLRSYLCDEAGRLKNTGMSHVDALSVRYTFKVTTKGEKVVGKLVLSDVERKKLEKQYPPNAELESQTEDASWAKERTYLAVPPYHALEPYIPPRKYERMAISKKESSKDMQPIPRESMRMKSVMIEPYKKGVHLRGKGDTAGAEEAFLEAIKQEDNVSVAVNSLADIYMQQGNPQKGLEVLDECQDKLTQTERSVLRIRLLEKARDYDKLAEEYTKAIRTEFRPNRRLHYIMQLANIHQRMNNYEDVIKWCEEWRRIKASVSARFTYSDRVKYKHIEENVRIKIAASYYSLGQKKMAKELATKLLSESPDNTLAKAIINDTYETGAELSTQKEDDFDIENDSVFGDSSLHPYAQFKIESIEPSTMGGKNNFRRHMKGDAYTGPITAAKDDVISYINRIKYMPAQEKSDAWAFLANIVAQLVNTHGAENKSLKAAHLTPMEVILYAGRSMMSAGDFEYQRFEGNLDATRFFYSEVMDMVPESQADSKNAFTRYVSTFFLNYEKRQDMIKKGVNDEYYLDCIRQEKCDNPDEFLLGTFFLSERVQKRTSLLLEEVSKNKTWQGELRSFVERYLGKITTESNVDSWLKAKKEYNRRMADLKETLEDAESNLDNKDSFERDRDKINKYLHDGHILCKTDNDNVRSYVEMLSKLQEAPYHDDFTQKSDDYRLVGEMAKALLENIYLAPTRLSFETLQDLVLALQTRAHDGLDQLYHISEPEVSFKTRITKSVEGGKNVQFVLKITNEPNRQPADLYEISVLSLSEGCEIVAVSPTLRHIRGGNTEEQLFNAEFQGEIPEYFEVRLSGKMIYNYSREEKKEQDILVDFHLALTEQMDYEPIENRYTVLTEGNGVPLDSDMFYGRSEDISRIVGMLQLPNGKPMSGRGIYLYGQKRTGKTSILDRLKKNIRDSYGKDAYIIIEIGSVGEYGSSDNPFFDVLAAMIRNFKRALRKDYKELYDYLQEYDIEFPSEKISLNENGTGFGIFKSALEEILDAIHDFIGNEKLIPMFLFDEFTYFYEWIKTKRIDNNFMKFWKALLENNQICSIVVGMDNMPAFVQEFKNEFACMTPFRVTYLQEKDAKDMADKPMCLSNGESRYEKEAIDYIYELTAGSAYLIAIFCDRFVCYLNDTRTLHITKTVIDNFIRQRFFGDVPEADGSIIFDPQLGDPSKFGEDNKITARDNKEVLSYIAMHANGKAGDGEIAINAIDCSAQLSNKEPSYLKSLVEQLINRDVLQSRVEGYCTIKIGLLRIWLRREKGELI